MKPQQRDESGLVLVWTALFLTVLLGFAAVAVDLGHAYYVSQRAQNASDAAALAGAPYLPADLAGAQNAALELASANGFTNGVDGTTVTASPSPDNPSELDVTIHQNVPTWFARIIGFKQMTVGKGADRGRKPGERGRPRRHGADPRPHRQHVGGGPPEREGRIERAARHARPVGRPRCPGRSRPQQHDEPVRRERERRRLRAEGLGRGDDMDRSAVPDGSVALRLPERRRHAQHLEHAREDHQLPQHVERRHRPR